jgi:hypothetical protein
MCPVLYGVLCPPLLTTAILWLYLETLRASFSSSCLKQSRHIVISKVLRKQLVFMSLRKQGQQKPIVVLMLLSVLASQIDGNWVGCVVHRGEVHLFHGKETLSSVGRRALHQYFSVTGFSTWDSKHGSRNTAVHFFFTVYPTAGTVPGTE